MTSTDPVPLRALSPARRPWRMLGCASQGTGGDDEMRLRTLLGAFHAEYIPFDKRAKLKSFFSCLRAVRSQPHDLLVLEGTGVAAGLAAILGRCLFGKRFVLSSGDAVEPFLSASLPLGKPVFALYERLLYRTCSGFIGWTPYLVGRALTLGATRAMTCPGWSPQPASPARRRPDRRESRRDVRARLGIPEDAIVFGIAGSLVWSSRYRYCYGLELIRAARQSRAPVYVLIVGGGDGLAHLQQAAGAALNRTIFLTGRVPRDEVPAYLAAMDAGSLPQSVDSVGSFRYSTKIAEYRSLGLPFITNRIPMSYDLDGGDLWRLPGRTPWSAEFINALSELMTRARSIDFSRRAAASRATDDFGREEQIERVTAFLDDLCTAP